ncbi:MAG: bifunctional DNA-formamidopyrimidine glycosylase/DNA-(apurinic or apyrimidinic site) lyase [Hyphomicrobiaceae bacterium]
MPELPEVETVRRGLVPAMVGARFAQVEQRRADLRFPFPERFAARLEGRRLLSLTRRAKYLIGEIEGGERLLMHLGMSGRFTVAADAPSTGTVAVLYHATGMAAAHDHVVFHMAGGPAGDAAVTYNDPRRFGFMTLVAEAEVETHRLLAGLGVEPLSNAFDAVYLADAAAGRSCDLKAFLLDQRVVAGLGNIYVSEALFRAGLSPVRRAGSLVDRRGRPSERAERLVAAIRDVLGDAIAAGGSSLRDYVHTDGSLGYFQHAFKVYDRDGAPCPRDGCSGTIGRIVQSGRSTYRCGRCQR